MFSTKQSNPGRVTSFQWSYSAQRDIEHSHNAVTERFMAIERYRPEELLELPSCVAHGGSNMFEIDLTHLARVLTNSVPSSFSNEHPEQRTGCVHESGSLR